MTSSKDIATIKSAFVKAYASVGEANDTGAKRGEVLKRQTETLLEFSNGLDAVLDSVKAIVAEHLKVEPKPMPKDGIKRRDDPVCAKWDAKYKRVLHNPLTQVNGALAAAKVGQVIRLSNAGVVTVEAATEGGSPATIKTIKGALDRLPFTAQMHAEVVAAVLAWKEAGEAAMRATAEPVVAPTIDPELAAAFEAFMAARKAAA